MKIRLHKVSPAIVWASLFLAILPLALFACLDLALVRDALTQEKFDRWLPPLSTLSSPALLLSRLAGYSPRSLMAQSAGAAYWGLLGGYLLANFVAWLVLIKFATFLAGALKCWISARWRLPGAFD